MQIYYSQIPKLCQHKFLFFRFLKRIKLCSKKTGRYKRRAEVFYPPCQLRCHPPFRQGWLWCTLSAKEAGGQPHSNRVGLLQSVEKPPNRQNARSHSKRTAQSLLPGEKVSKILIFDGCGAKVLAAQGILTYCTKRNLPYHLYADGCVLFVFGAFLASASLSKRLF